MIHPPDLLPSEQAIVESLQADFQTWSESVRGLLALHEKTVNEKKMAETWLAILQDRLEKKVIEGAFRKPLLLRLNADQQLEFYYFEHP